ncbi:hypothetical protein M0208_13425 [Sphingomonas sp. SUN019]|uniref:DUF2306 domain-containing protein n=1 Tax=Sphingomonas sp. SUN019 TaxID=2937788 RepID=UPI0021649F8C|nr:hypothetical protein [Sphingomonas sp. SUN019]UVO51454.1 hypothetical protein M0208_13425 [Sphingomonas sp. SUN019]
MATTAADARRAKGLGVDLYEKILSVAATILLVAACTAILRGQSEWLRVPALIWAHLATVLIATGLTPVMLLRRRGDARHRLLGTVWVVAMLATVLLSLGVRTGGGFSVIHILSLWTLVQVPIIWWSARTHNVVRHRRAVRGMVTGALVVAGFFTFPFDRLLGHWLFG